MEARTMQFAGSQRRQGLGFYARSYQRPYLGAYAREEFKRFYRVQARRGGKDDCGLCGLIQRVVRREAGGRIANYWYGFPEFEQARRALWDNICGHNMRMVEHVPPNARAGRHWLDESNMQVHFRRGSILQLLGVKDPNKIRGPNPAEIHLSEWAQCNPGALDVVTPILLVNNGTLSLNTTPFGRNHAWRLWQRVTGNVAWWTELLPVEHMHRDAAGEDGRSILSPQWPEPERTVDEALAALEAEGQDADFIAQEYRCSWAGSMTGSYYGALIERARAAGQIGRVPHERGVPVHTYWDRGDSCAVWFIQNAGRRRHVIDYLETHGEGLPEIMDKLKRGHRAAYKYGRFVAGHDMFESRDFTTGNTAYEYARSVGIEFEDVPRLSLLDGVDAGRKIIGRCWWDEARCERGLDALISYHRKWDEQSKAFSAKPPRRHWANHGADAWRYFAVGDRSDDAAAPGRTTPGRGTWSGSGQGWQSV